MPRQTKNTTLPIEPKYLPAHIAAKYVSMCVMDFIKFAAQHSVRPAVFEGKKFSYYSVNDIDTVFENNKNLTV